MKCNLYILANSKGKHYVGITKLSLEERLAMHNKGEVFATKSGKPWGIVYVKEFKDYREARRREKQMNGWKGANDLEKFLKITTEGKV